MFSIARYLEAMHSFTDPYAQASWIPIPFANSTTHPPLKVRWTLLFSGLAANKSAFNKTSALSGYCPFLIGLMPEAYCQ